MMTTIKVVSDLEILQTADELVIRLRRKNVVVGVILASVCVPFSLAIAYQNIVGTAGVPSIWNRSRGDRIFALVAIPLTLLAFGVAPIWVCGALVRNRRRAWVFNRPRAKLTRMDQCWALVDLTAVAVDVRRGKFKNQSAAVLLHFGQSQAVEIKRYHAGGQKAHVPLERCIYAATDLANIVGAFLHVPVLHPPRPNQGFDVIPRSGF